MTETELDLTTELQAWEDQVQGDRDPTAGPSDASRCRRELGYRLLGTDADLEYDDDKSAATTGSLLHLAVAAVRQLMLPAADVELAVAVPGLEREGRLDAYLDGVVDDLKTQGCHGWDRTNAEGVMREKDRGQLGIYALGLEAAGKPVHTLQASYLNRCTGASWTARVPFDRDHAMAALMRLHAVLDAADAGKLMPRDEPHPRAKACTLCPFRRRCWELDSAPAEGPGPLTDTDELDRWQSSASDELPASLAELARRRMELHAQLEELEDAKRAADQQLRGWQGATFTDAAGITRRVAWTNPSAPGQVDDGKAAAELLRELGVDVPQTTGRATSAALHLRTLPKAKGRKAATKLEG